MRSPSTATPGVSSQGTVSVALSSDQRSIGALGVTEPHDCPYPVLAWIYVATEHRRHGVGHALVRGMVERFGTEIGFDVEPPPTEAVKALMAGCPDVAWHEHENTNLKALNQWRAKRETNQRQMRRRRRDSS